MQTSYRSDTKTCMSSCEAGGDAEVKCRREEKVNEREASWESGWGDSREAGDASELQEEIRRCI